MLPQMRGREENSMGNILLALVILAIILVLMYILYINGFLTYNAKTALLYKGTASFGKAQNYRKAKFSSCSGMTKSVIRLEKGKAYQFALFQSVTKGTVYVEIQDGKGEIIRKLDDEAPAATIIAEEKTRCCLVTKFVNADGEYTLCWDRK